MALAVAVPCDACPRRPAANDLQASHEWWVSEMVDDGDREEYAMWSAPAECARQMVVASARRAWAGHRIQDVVACLEALGFTEHEVLRISLLRHRFERSAPRSDRENCA